MKKIFLNLALILGFSTFAMAQDYTPTSDKFIDALFQDKVSEAYDMLSEQAQTMIPIEQLEAIVTQISSQLGQPTEDNGSVEAIEDNYYVVYRNFKYKAGDFDWKIVMNEAHEVEGFFIVPHEDRSGVKKN